MWTEVNDGKTIGEIGSEDGIIIKDEEYKGSCRITLEECKEYYAITCGIYDGMMHTAYADENSFESKYQKMKEDLQIIVGLREMSKDKFIEDFIRKY